MPDRVPASSVGRSPTHESPRSRDSEHDIHDEPTMNDSVTTKETEFIFRRLGESFLQFTTDFWHSVPKLLLVVAVILLIAKMGYSRATRPRSRQDRFD